MPSDDVFATVRSVRPDPSGQVQIAYDETRRRVLSGRADDQAIQKLLLAAAHEENASVRVESMNLLKERTGSSEVRDALLNALAHDPNDGVRLQSARRLEAPGRRCGCPQDALPGAVERTRIRRCGCRSWTFWSRIATIPSLEFCKDSCSAKITITCA